VYTQVYTSISNIYWDLGIRGKLPLPSPNAISFSNKHYNAAVLERKLKNKRWRM